MLDLLTIVCPPFAVLLIGRPTQTAANIGLTLLGYLPGLLHARALVDQRKVGRRNELIMRLAERYCS